MVYLDWKRPTMYKTDSENNDALKEVEMLYDLELDIAGNIIGGQWRTTEVGKGFLNLNAKRTQPDFFWAVTKHWKKSGEVKGKYKSYFNENDQVSKWEDFTKSPPNDWKFAAYEAHKFTYKKTNDLGWNEKCKVVRKRGTGRAASVDVPCEFKINKPQPFINLVNKLIELSRE